MEDEKTDAVELTVFPSGQDKGVNVSFWLNKVDDIVLVKAEVDDLDQTLIEFDSSGLSVTPRYIDHTIPLKRVRSDVESSGLHVDEV